MELVTELEPAVEENVELNDNIQGDIVGETDDIIRSVTSFIDKDITAM